MDFKEFISQIKENEVAIFEGEEVSPFSNKKYAYYEIVLFFEDGSEQILCYSNSIVKTKEKVALTEVRVAVLPSVEKTLTQKELASKKSLSDFEKHLLETMKKQNSKTITVKEFGLEANREYFLSKGQGSYFGRPSYLDEQEVIIYEFAIISDNKTKQLTPRYSKFL